MRTTILLLTVMIFLLSACGGDTADSNTNTPPSEATNAPAETAPTSQPAASDNSAVPLDTTSLDVCAMLPEANVTAIIGALRNAPEAAESIGDERGCTYLTEDGHSYTIYLVPLDRWDIVTAVYSDTEPVPNLGDQALLRKVGSNNSLYVLLDGVVMVQIDNTTSDSDISIQLAQMTLGIIQG